MLRNKSVNVPELFMSHVQLIVVVVVVVDVQIIVI